MPISISGAVEAGKAAWSRAAPSLFLPQAIGKGRHGRVGAARRGEAARTISRPLSAFAGALDGGVLVICDHAANALPPRYGDLGLPREALERHIAYDIGAAWLARRLAERLGAPAMLSTFSRLLIDPNRGGDDPTLVMRISDGDLVPGNARIDAAEIERRRRRYLGALPRGDRGDGRSDAGERRAAGDPLDPFFHAVLARAARGRGRSACCGTPTRACRAPLIRALGAEPDIGPEAVGDNEPYDGALPGDTINAVATARGLSNALIEMRQDLIGERAGAEAWADRLARIVAPIAAPRRPVRRKTGAAAPTAAAPAAAA